MNKKILLIEDDDFIRELYEGELLRCGFEVLACPSGEKGLEAIKTTQFDLVLLDIMLPGINGLEALKQIKSNPTVKGLKVVLLTNLGNEAVIKQGFELGAIGYLVKSSLNPDQVINEVKGFINGTNSTVPPSQGAS